MYMYIYICIYIYMYICTSKKLQILSKYYLRLEISKYLWTNKKRTIKLPKIKTQRTFSSWQSTSRAHQASACRRATSPHRGPPGSPSWHQSRSTGHRDHQWYLSCSSRISLILGHPEGDMVFRIFCTCLYVHIDINGGFQWGYPQIIHLLRWYFHWWRACHLDSWSRHGHQLSNERGNGWPRMDISCIL